MSFLTQTSIVAAATLGLAGFSLGYALSTTGKTQSKPQFIASPLSSLLPKLSKDQVDRLPYPPDFYPGARDVSTPYGKMRVYEWGPTDGKKIVLVSGDTSPSPIFGVIAKEMVERGFRVILFDTWGRGYSDSPLSAPHDLRLYALQIVFALVSSPISWTSTSDSFSIIGFSLGGAIAMSFASYFPNQIESIVLLAPVGVLRSRPKDYDSIYLRNHHWVPRFYLRRVVAAAIGVSLQKQAVSTSESATSKKVSMDAPDLPAIFQWQFDTHEGFVHSFADTVRNNPQQNQQHEWKRACDIICSNNTDTATAHYNLRNSRVLIICGESDGVVVASEVEEDFSRLLPGHVEFRTVPGGHGFLVPSAEPTVQHICRFWSIPEHRVFNSVNT